MARVLIALLFVIAAASVGFAVLEAQRADSAIRLSHHVEAAATSVSSDAIAARIDAANAEATATIAAGSAAQAQGTAQAVSMGVLAQPTPGTPTLTTCFLEDFNTTAFACQRTISHVNLAAVPDLAVVFDGHGQVSGYASLTWRVFKAQDNGLNTTLGSYTDTNVDPQDDSTQWTLSALFSSLVANDGSTADPQAGNYKIEILSPSGAVLAVDDVAIVQSGGYIDPM